MGRQVIAEPLEVDDGDVITSAGVSAGIDMALYLVVRLAGEGRARQVKPGLWALAGLSLLFFVFYPYA